MGFIFHLILFLSFIVDESATGPRPRLHNCRQIRARLRSPDRNPAPPAQVPVWVALGWLAAPSSLWGQSSDPVLSPGERTHSGRPPCSVFCDVTNSWEPVCLRDAAPGAGEPTSVATRPGVHPASLLHSAQQWRWQVR